MEHEYIITSIKDVIWYIENEDCIVSRQQVKDINRIFNDNLCYIRNKSYYIEKLDKIKWKLLYNNK